MELIYFDCPSCQHRLVVPPQAAAMSGPCPDCGTLIHGPNSPEAPRETTIANQERVLEPTGASPSQIPSEPRIHEPSPRPASSPIIEDSPSPDSESRAAAPATSKLRFSLPLLFLLAFLLSALFFLLGFLFGKTGRDEPARPQVLPQIPSQAGTETTAPPLADKTTSPVEFDIDELAKKPLPIPQSNATTASARSALEAFLAAPSWGVRNAYVLKPDEALTEMESMAQRYGDGPIPYDDIALAHDSPEEQVFQLLTPKDDKPFLVSVVKNGALWGVEWDLFAEFYYDQFENFVKGEQGASEGIFHLRLKPAPGETDPLTPARLLATSPNSQESFQLTFGTASDARSKIADLFSILKRSQPDLLKSLLESDGIPLVVKITRSGATNPELRLTEVVATSWSRKALTN